MVYKEEDYSHDTRDCAYVCYLPIYPRECLCLKNRRFLKTKIL